MGLYILINEKGLRRVLNWRTTRRKWGLYCKGRLKPDFTKTDLDVQAGPRTAFSLKSQQLLWPLKRLQNSYVSQISGYSLWLGLSELVSVFISSIKTCRFIGDNVRFGPKLPFFPLLENINRRSICYTSHEICLNKFIANFSLMLHSWQSIFQILCNELEYITFYGGKKLKTMFIKDLFNV